MFCTIKAQGAFVGEVVRAIVPGFKPSFLYFYLLE